MKSTSTTQEDWAIWDKLPIFGECARRGTHKDLPKRRKQMTAMKPITEEQSLNCLSKKK